MKSKILILFFGFLLGLITAFVIIDLSADYINYCLKPSLPEYIYYISQLIGVLATSLAVVVALWGKEIKDAIFKPKCVLFLEKDGFVENLGDTAGSSSPKAGFYESILNVKNDGPREISECALFLNTISYKSNESQKKANTILKNAHAHLYWGTKSDKWIGLIAEDTREIPLFRIYPNSAMQTPDGEKTSMKRLSIMGYNIDERYSKQGIWEIGYTLQTKEKVLQKFLLTIKWNGEWFDREQEMGNVLEVKFAKQ